MCTACRESGIATIHLSPWFFCYCIQATLLSTVDTPLPLPTNSPQRGCAEEQSGTSTSFNTPSPLKHKKRSTHRSTRERHPPDYFGDLWFTQPLAGCLDDTSPLPGFLCCNNKQSPCPSICNLLPKAHIPVVSPNWRLATMGDSVSKDSKSPRVPVSPTRTLRPSPRPWDGFYAVNFD